MQKNVGKTDRTIRLVLGVVILVVGLFAQSWWGLVGLIPLITGLVRWCPIYVPFKLSTLPRARSGAF